MKLFGLCFFAVLTTACGSSMLDSAVYAANGARSTELAAGDLLRERCTNKYRAAGQQLSGPDLVARVNEISRTCDPARKSYGVLRSARLVLLAAIVTYKATGNEAALLEAVRQMGEAASSTASTVRMLEAEP